MSAFGCEIIDIEPQKMDRDNFASELENFTHDQELAMFDVLDQMDAGRRSSSEKSEEELDDFGAKIMEFAQAGEDSMMRIFENVDDTGLEMAPPLVPQKTEDEDYSVSDLVRNALNDDDVEISTALSCQMRSSMSGLRRSSSKTDTALPSDDIQEHCQKRLSLQEFLSGGPGMLSSTEASAESDNEELSLLEMLGSAGPDETQSVSKKKKPQPLSRHGKSEEIKEKQSAEASQTEGETETGGKGEAEIHVEYEKGSEIIGEDEKSEDDESEIEEKHFQELLKENRTRRDTIDKDFEEQKQLEETNVPFWERIRGPKVQTKPKETSESIIARKQSITRKFSKSRETLTRPGSQIHDLIDDIEKEDKQVNQAPGESPVVANEDIEFEEDAEYSTDSNSVASLATIQSADLRELYPKVAERIAQYEYGWDQEDSTTSDSESSSIDLDEMQFKFWTGTRWKRISVLERRDRWVQIKSKFGKKQWIDITRNPVKGLSPKLPKRKQKTFPNEESPLSVTRDSTYHDEFDEPTRVIGSVHDEFDEPTPRLPPPPKTPPPKTIGFNTKYIIPSSPENSITPSPPNSPPPILVQEEEAACDDTIFSPRYKSLLEEESKKDPACGGKKSDVVAARPFGLSTGTTRSFKNDPTRGVVQSTRRRKLSTQI